jgi:hypothetical protein
MEKKDSNQEVDRLLAEAKELQKRSDLHSKVKKNTDVYSQASDTIKELGENLNFVKKTVTDTKEATAGIYENVLRPIWSIIGPPFNLVIRLYKRFWRRFAYYTDKNTAERVLSRRRSGVVVAITFFFLAMFSPTWVGNSIRFFTIEPLIDGLLIASSMRTEIFYLNHSEEIDPENNVHSVRGCRSEGVCTERDAAYFRVRPRLSHDIWKLIKYDNPIYVPDHVVAPIAPGVNRCMVTYYGYRMTSSWIARLLRSLQFYPTMLECTCNYVGGHDQPTPSEAKPKTQE